jgi:hypothetical protein
VYCHGAAQKHWKSRYPVKKNKQFSPEIESFLWLLNRKNIKADHIIQSAWKICHSEKKGITSMPFCVFRGIHLSRSTSIGLEIRSATAKGFLIRNISFVLRIHSILNISIISSISHFKITSLTSDSFVSLTFPILSCCLMVFPNQHSFPVNGSMIPSHMTYQALPFIAMSLRPAPSWTLHCKILDSPKLPSAFLSDITDSMLN